MTLKEAKKILNKEGFAVDRFIDVKAYDIKVPSWEKVEVGEAMKVVVGNDYMPLMHVSKYKEREARLKEEYGKYHIKGDFSGNKSIEHCGEPIPGSPLSAVEGIKLKWKDNQNTSENSALEESASQFNDALLDEQAKEIKCIKEKNLRLGREIARLNKNIYKKNMKIEELRKESSRHLRGKIKMFGENVDLEQMLKDKDAVLSDVAEELRLSKIREKNLTEVSQKYMKENEELKKKLAAKIVDKIDAQTLRSAESALAYKEKEIADLDKELKAKHKKYVWYKGAYEAAQQILNTIADYAAKHPDKKFSDQMVQDAHVECGTKVLVDKSVFEQIMKKAYGK